MAFRNNYTGHCIEGINKQHNMIACISALKQAYYYKISNNNKKKKKTITVNETVNNTYHLPT